MVVVSLLNEEGDVMCAKLLDEVVKFRGQYMVAQNAEDVEGCVSFWLDEGALMPPNEPSVVGKEALRAYYNEAFRHVSLEAKFEYQHAENAGGWMFARGSYTAKIAPKAGGDPIFDQGKVLEILKRGDDGSWKCACHMWSSDNPLG